MREVLPGDFTRGRQQDGGMFAGSRCAALR
jgi:hypothetical protein